MNTAGTLWAGIGIGRYAAALALFLGAIEAARRAPMTRTFVSTHNLVFLATAIFMIGWYVVSAAEEERRLATGPQRIQQISRVTYVETIAGTDAR